MKNHLSKAQKQDSSLFRIREVWWLLVMHWFLHIWWPTANSSNSCSAKENLSASNHCETLGWICGGLKPTSESCLNADSLPAYCNRSESIIIDEPKRSGMWGLDSASRAEQLCHFALQQASCSNYVTISGAISDSGLWGSEVQTPCCSRVVKGNVW